ncbi:hypothetical protein CC2G_010802 [Coprinopsis cinerea AmutBmut pab1-1]|nr:hypothetical protein CC2G_010802 [Coprinopsis cinerea AmutBmut pab1-1]
MPNPFILVSPGATRGLGLALTRQFLRTTSLPVYTSHRRQVNDKDIKTHILGPLPDVDPKRLHLLHIDLTSEDTMAHAAKTLKTSLKKHVGEDPYLQTAFITGGVLFPEKQPSDLQWDHLKETFQINTISHLLMIKHFSQFLPPTNQEQFRKLEKPSKGGWYSYRSSKAALNQVVKTFDIHLGLHNINAICVGVHPGTVKTDLSKGYWGSEAKPELFEPETAAQNLADVVENLKTEQRGTIWDWAHEEIPW